MNSVLIIDDDKELCALMKKCVEQENLSAVVAYGGLEGLRLLEENKDACSLIILDVMMPDMDGFQVLQKIREKHNVPVLMLTAKSDEEDKVSGLRLGADDYLTKPFSLAVLRARVNNLLRRGAVPRGEVVELPPFSFDFAGMAFSRNGEAIELSKTEQRLLRLLVEHRGQTLTREQLLDRVWDGGEFVDENALSVAVRRLRAKLGDAPIKTVYGLGYTWEIQ